CEERTKEGNGMITRWLLLSLAIALSSGYATSSSLRTPITDRSQRMSFRGFSILPPQGDNWYIKSRDPGGVAFAKFLMDASNRASAEHTLAAIATVVYPKEGIVADLRAHAEYRNRSEDRWTTLQARVTPYQLTQHPDVECLR